jgi:hypothetical protein
MQWSVWQHGFHDHAIRKEEDVKAIDISSPTRCVPAWLRLSVIIPYGMQYGYDMAAQNSRLKPRIRYIT